MTPECTCPWACYRHVWQAWGAGGAGKGLSLANGASAGNRASGLPFAPVIGNSAEGDCK